MSKNINFYIKPCTQSTYKLIPLPPHSLLISPPRSPSSAKYLCLNSDFFHDYLEQNKSPLPTIYTYNKINKTSSWCIQFLKLCMYNLHGMIFF